MSKTTSVNHMWTKKEIKLIAELWKTKSKIEVVSSLGVEPSQISAIIANMRKCGYVLPKKHKNGQLRALIYECMKDEGLTPNEE